jgi:hypothetical protein
MIAATHIADANAPHHNPVAGGRTFRITQGGGSNDIGDSHGGASRTGRLQKFAPGGSLLFLHRGFL